MDANNTNRFHSFSKLVLTLRESSLEGVYTDHSFELRAAQNGAEVWRSSVLYAAGGSCASDEKYIGFLTARQVIELLDEIERSGIYEALPAAGVVQGQVINDNVPLVSMKLESSSQQRTVLDSVPANRSIANDLAQAVRKRVDLAMERALTSAG